MPKTRGCWIQISEEVDRRKDENDSVCVRPRSVSLLTVYQSSRLKKHEADGYWVEIIGQNPAEKTEDVKETDTGVYRMVYSATILRLFVRGPKIMLNHHCPEPHHDPRQRPHRVPSILSRGNGYDPYAHL